MIQISFRESEEICLAGPLLALASSGKHAHIVCVEAAEDVGLAAEFAPITEPLPSNILTAKKLKILPHQSINWAKVGQGHFGRYKGNVPRI